ncbi:MAG TPA: DUF4412 domain-containing protein [Puia sp.]|nr:DUF4412 domain-containing protein [Puia sp.]
MKKLTLTAVLLGFLHLAHAQFEGVLYYDCTIKNKTLTTIYSSGKKVLLEAKTYPMKEGAVDISKAKEQDALIFDFAAGKVTRLSTRRKVAVTTSIGPVTSDREANPKQEDVTIRDLGAEKIGAYACHHFAVTVKNKKSDIWITKDLGTSSLCLLAQFDYYPAGSLLYDKLKEAGGEGVVVRCQSGNVVVNLTNVQRKTVPVSFFEIPDGYSKN